VNVYPNEKVGLALKKLEVSNYRLGMKIGVIFVAPHAENQNQILSTTFEQTSAHFREFLTGLGWQVKLDSHTGYNGGLDCKNRQNGTTSIYYADFTNEIMFHVAPLIPTDPKDDQQIYKKRHIGNDHVHIVWSEANREYDPSTITSQFNQAHIVIHTLETGLFRVDVLWRKELGWFGPLRWRVVVGKKALPSLVRATAVAAMNAFYKTQSPFSYRQSEIVAGINEIFQSHLVKEERFAAIQTVMQLGQ
jgi:hypothetical protein